MTAITNTFTHRVIEADEYDPDVSWAHHRARGSSGGVDLSYPAGTTVASPAAGRLLYIVGNGTGGNIGVLYLDDGRRIELMHLSALIGTNNRRVAAGEAIVKSGASGTPAAGGAYAAHLHVHVVLASGVRANLFHYFTAAAPASSPRPAPIAPTPHVPIAPAPQPHLTPGDEELAEPIYAKGDKDPNVYALYVNAGDSNSATGLAGAVYSGRRWVNAGEFRIVEALGFPHPKQDELIVIPQAMFDLINKLAGSL